MNLSKNLTSKQLIVLQFIKKYYKKNNIIPTIREIVSGLGYKSNSIVAFHIDALVDKQYLSRVPYKNRSLIILKDVICE
ncbi:repressor LexA [uncultured Mediterranean phage]|nr:repressor LexA [uncultured Mediterranean phage]